MSFFELQIINSLNQINLLDAKKKIPEALKTWTLKPFMLYIYSKSRRKQEKKIFFVDIVAVSIIYQLNLTLPSLFLVIRELLISDQSHLITYIKTIMNIHVLCA